MYTALRIVTLTAATLAAAVTSASASRILIVDDFNAATASFVFDAVADGVPVTGGTTIDGGNIVMGAANGSNGWTRQIAADLDMGDMLMTSICASCQAAHYVGGAGGGYGVSSWIYTSGGTGTMVNLSALSFKYAADHDGADIVFSFGRNGTVVTFNIMDLPGTGSSSTANLTQVTRYLPQADPTWQFVFANMTDVRIDITGDGDLDLSLDDVVLAEPVSLAGLVLGLVGLAGVRRRTGRTRI